MTFGQRLATLRKQNRLTQQKLGEQLNVSAQAVSKWENDQAEPDVATICRLAKIYNISTDALLMGTENFGKGSSATNCFTQSRGSKGPPSPKRRALLFVIVATITCLIATIVLLGVFVFSDDLATKPTHTPAAAFISSYFTHIKGDILS